MRGRYLIPDEPYEKKPESTFTSRQRKNGADFGSGEPVVKTDLFAVDDLAGHSLPDGRVLARNRRTGAQMALPAEVFNAISYCDAFRTMEAHISHLAGPAAGGREDEIRRILQTVINGGLMLSADAIGTSLQPGKESVVPEAPVVAIITCDRPQVLARLLSSMREQCQLEGIHEIVVVDGSRSEVSTEANRQVIDDAGQAPGSDGLREIRHFTPDDASTLMRALIERIPKHERGIRFVLDREGRTAEVTTGISRNLAQLLSVGRPLLVFDDDVLCSVMEPPHSTPGVEFSAHQRECRFYGSDADWANLKSESAHCPVQRHLQALGSSLADCLANLGQEAPGPDSFEFTGPEFAVRLRRDSRIMISQCGSYGDPGSAGNEWIALLPAEIRAQLAGLIDDIGTSAEERNCWLGRSRPVFGPRANMSQLTGLDNRHYLPPYFPLFRGQDRSFGAMTEFLYPNNVTVDLPFALPHLPTPGRTWKSSNRGVALPFGLKHFLHEFVVGNVTACASEQIDQRNEWLAMLFTDLAGSPQTRITEITANHWTQRRIDWLTRLSQALNDPAPVHLGGFLNDLLTQVQGNNISDFHNARLEGPPSGTDSEGVLRYWRSAWRDYSAGLRAWPLVRETWGQSKGTE
jgi:hypothetical protein